MIEVLRRPVEFALTPMVGVHDGVLFVAMASPDRHLQRVGDELCTQVIGNRPTDDATAVGVDHRCEIDLALGRSVLGDVADPQRVRTLDREAPVHEIV
jgi:hypothetical protein